MFSRLASIIQINVHLDDEIKNILYIWDGSAISSDSFLFSDSAQTSK